MGGFLLRFDSGYDGCDFVYVYNCLLFWLFLVGEKRCDF